uniref:cell adhesion molecule CEACAM5 n=1 Tax=Centroberyx gerrardi TaxID=166262 RepID=UPI003AB0D212
METAVVLLIILGVISGLSHGAGVIPDLLNAAVGGSVTFTTTLTPPEKPFVVVSWTFTTNGTTTTIITSTSSDTVGPGYQDRITFIRSTGSLELRNLALSDSGEYRVSIVPDGGVALTGNSRLEIYLPVSNVVVTPNTTDLSEFNSSVSLSCSSSGSSLSFLWLNGSSEVSASEGVLIGDGGSTLTIVSVTRYDEGPFTCQVSNPVSNAKSDPVSLSINFGPENTNLKLSPSKEYYEEGSNISLSCSADSRPAALFHWALNEVLLSDTGPELRLNNIQMRQSGNYSCQAHNSKTLRYQTSQPSLVTVLGNNVSNVVVTPNTTDLSEFNSSVSLSCSSSGSSLSFLWLNGSSEVSASEGVLIGDGGSTLTIVSVTRYDEGPFTCQVSNPVSNVKSVPVSLSINFGPENTNLKLSPSKEYYEEGSNIILSCSADSRPAALFHWALNEVLLTDTGPELRLNNIQMRQSGNYRCQAHNSKTLRYQTSQPSLVTVLERISGASITGSTNLPVEGNSVNLTCDAAGSVPTREWRKDGSPLNNDITLHDEGRLLSFSALKRTDSGEYSCKVSNPISSEEAKYKMVVNYGPESVKITGPSEIEVEQTLELTCSAESVPTASYIWRLNGTEILRNSAVFTKIVTEVSDSGNYTCLSHGAGVIPDLLNAAVGGSVTFTTTLTPPEKPFTVVIWTFDTNGMTTNIITSSTSDTVGPGYQDRITFSRSTGSLELRNLALSDRGEYRVIIVPDGGLALTGDSRLEIYQRISGASITGSTNLPVEGNSVNLTCDAAGSVPTREWRKDGSPLNNDITLHDEGRLLSFSALKRTDSGEYSCKVSNPISSEEAKYNMVVNYGPESVKITGPSEIEVDQTLELTCSAESVPTASYIWRLNGTEILRNSAVFTKTVTGDSDSGNGPEKAAIVGPSSAEIGAVTLLYCSAASVPAATFSWLFNGNQTDVHGAAYVIPSSSSSDYGKYTCAAKNDATGLSETVDHVLSVKARDCSVAIGRTAGIAVACFVSVAGLTGAFVLLVIRRMRNAAAHCPFSNTSPYEAQHHSLKSS